jgi:hypothetical protein
LVSELVDYRLCRYCDTREGGGGEWRLRVGQTNDRPIVWLNREQNPGLPEGDVEVVADGRRYVASFMKIALNVMRDAEAPAGNELPALMRRWFGEAAGAPGTSQVVVLSRVEDGLVLEATST